MTGISSISIDPRVMGGKPVVAGTRISVEHILELLSGGWSEADIQKQYPHITRNAIHAVLRYATALAKDETVFPLPPATSVTSYATAR